MADIPVYSYSHPNGWNDTVNFPTTPSSEPATRALLQEQHAEILTNLNDCGTKINARKLRNYMGVRFNG